MSDYASMVEINRFNLPKECAEHSGRYLEISEKKAEIQAELDALKDELKLHLAESDIKVRAKWDVDEDGKMTESGVSAKVTSLDSVIERQEIIREKTKELAIVDVVKSAFEHRKSMLNNLTSLLIGGFYAAPEGAKKESTSSNKDRALRRAINGED